MLKGKKTYLTGVLMIVLGVVAVLLGEMDKAEAIQSVLGGLGMIFIRSGIAGKFNLL